MTYCLIYKCEEFLALRSYIELIGYQTGEDRLSPERATGTDEPFSQLRPHDLLVRVRTAGLNCAEAPKRREHRGTRENTL